MTSVLLTGATGLVGARLLPRLSAAGFECRALIRRNTDLPAPVTSVLGDLEDPGSLPGAVEGVDAIVHLAALFRTGDEAAIWKANRDGTRNLVAAAQAHAPGARFIMASTGNVYNPDSSRPAREDDRCEPSAAYPASKLAAEELLAPFGISAGELAVLLVIDSGEPETQQQIARRLGIDRTTMVSLIDALEARDLVARHPDAADRRRNVVKLTATGAKTLRQATEASDEAERRLLAALGKDEAAELRDLLHRVAAVPRAAG